MHKHIKIRRPSVGVFRTFCKGGGLPPPYPPPLDPFAGPRAKSSKPSFKTPNPNHLSGRALQKPRTPRVSFQRVTLCPFGKFVSGLRGFVIGLRGLGAGLRSFGTGVRGFGTETSKPSPTHPAPAFSRQPGPALAQPWPSPGPALAQAGPV